MDTIAELSRREATEVAETILEARSGDDDWLDELSEALDRRRAGRSLARILEVWDLSQAEAARLFGVSRQALSKWLAGGVPAERAVVVADLAAATDLLVRYVRRERIPAVVRRKAPALGGESLMDWVARSRAHDVLEACRQMFAFGEAQR
jgi:predicted transcriptional regulator